MSNEPLPRGAIAALSLAAFASATAMRVTDPLLPRLSSEFAVPLGDVASVITVFAIAYGVSQLFFGPVGDSYGKYRVIAWASLACAVTSMWCALAPSQSALLMARLMAGVTAGAIIPLAMAWIGDVTPYAQRQPVLARFLIGQITGLSAGVLLGGVAADHLSWRTPFVALAVWFALVGLIILALQRRLPGHAITTLQVQGGVLARMAGELQQVLNRPWARVVLATVFTEGACFFGAFAFIAVHLHHTHQVTLTFAASAVMLYGAGGLFYALTAPVLVARLGEVGLARWGGTLLTLSLLTIAYAPHWSIAGFACLAGGLGFYMLHNTLQINATQMASERRGAAVSIFACCFFLGQSVGVGLAGLAVAHASTATIITVGAAGVLAAGWNFARLKRRGLVQNQSAQSG